MRPASLLAVCWRLRGVFALSHGPASAVCLCAVCGHSLSVKPAVAVCLCALCGFIKDHRFVRGQLRLFASVLNEGLINGSPPTRRPAFVVCLRCAAGASVPLKDHDCVLGQLRLFALVYCVGLQRWCIIAGLAIRSGPAPAVCLLGRASCATRVIDLLRHEQRFAQDQL